MKELPSPGLQDPRNPQEIQNVEWEKEHLPISELEKSIRSTDTKQQIEFLCPTAYWIVFIFSRITRIGQIF